MANDTPEVRPREEILLCFSHLRWRFVFQRPQHLLSRAAIGRRVYFIEEPVFVDELSPASPDLSSPREGVTIVIPFISNQQRGEADKIQAQIVADIVAQNPGADLLLWYYTPMALAFTADLRASVVVYDCMDELSGFLGASPELGRMEKALFDKADLVFTGGRSLYEAKRKSHAHVHAFPSSVDAAHFAPARDGGKAEPPDQAALARPRVGYFGVIDERMDLALVDALAALRPHWSFIMIGPVVKVDAANLPARPNLHWLGPKSYDELPAYLAGWDAGFMPFALNDATRYISPTKTPEFLAAGVPVVSTRIVDVVDAYARFDVVAIADNADAFVAALEALMSTTRPARFGDVDAFLASQSWDAVWEAMERLIDEARPSHASAPGPSDPAASRAA